MSKEKDVIAENDQKNSSKVIEEQKEEKKEDKKGEKDEKDREKEE